MTDTTNPVVVDEEAASAAAAEAQAAEAAAAKAAAEAKPDEVITEGTEPQTEDNKSKEELSEEWGTTNDEVGDSVMLMLQNSGVDVETAQALLLGAVAAGDLNKIDKAALTKAVGKATATLILAGTENYINRNNARKAEVETLLHDTVGGQKQWAAIRDWAKTNLDTKDLLDYAAMVDQGGRKATLAAKDLKERFEEANGSVTDTTIVPNRNAPKTEKVEPLSRAAYFAEMEKLNRMGKLDDTAKKTLWLRREAGKQKNM